MTQAFAGAAAAAVLVAFWLLGRPRTRLIEADDGRLVAALNRERIERLREVGGSPVLPVQGSAGASEADPEGLEEMLAEWPAVPVPPMPPRERRLRLTRLSAASRGQSQERISAMAECLGWGDSAVLPLLLRGLRDADLRVAALAAEGLRRFRGRPGPLRSSRNGLSPVQPARLPRNVSRTL